jgi:hypothetical protein
VTLIAVIHTGRLHRSAAVGLAGIDLVKISVGTYGLKSAGFGYRGMGRN